MRFRFGVRFDLGVGLGLGVGFGLEVVFFLHFFVFIFFFSCSASYVNDADSSLAGRFGFRDHDSE